MFKQFFLAAFLIAAPVAAFFIVEHVIVAQPAGETPLGDLSALHDLTSRLQAAVDGGDMAEAAALATDFETQWDDAEPHLRPLDPVAWGAVDGAADTMLKSVRAAEPNLSTVETAVGDLLASLEHPSAPASGAVGMVAGVAVTDAAGHAIPCEDMIASVRDAVAKGGLSSTQAQAITELQGKATERCNADDDVRADSFSAQALAQASKGTVQ